MQAIVQDEYGTDAAKVLRLEDIEKPVPGDNDVLIRVRAASIHIGDWHVMTGLPYMLRVVGFGLRAPKVRIRGLDVAGTVEAVGSRVDKFRVGDDVFGTCEGASASGAFAEYACAPQGNFALKPAHLTYGQAAAVPTSAFAALQGLRDKGEVKKGQHVLIVGASGGVGLFAVQIARSFGAEVTGVCGASKADLVRNAGADHVIDYNKEDFSRGTTRYDVILDMGGNRSLADLRRALTPAGTLVLAGGEGGNRVLGGTDRWIQALVMSPFVKHRLRILSTSPNSDDLHVLKGMLESGDVAPFIAQTFPLSEVPAAMRCVAEGSPRGKVVIDIP
jgi:NADPH:quinone reductase-like Zn-dependent oxidoreductase